MSTPALVGEQVATKQDPRAACGGSRAAPRRHGAMEQRIKDQLTIRLGGMLAAAIAIVAAWSSYSER